MGKLYPAQRSPKPRAIVIHCIDPRFPEAFERFIEEDLDLNRHIDIIKKVEGGPTPLAYPTEMPSRCKEMRKKLEFSCEKFLSIETIIAIAHKSCAYYCTVPSHAFDNDDGRVEERDLQLIGNFLTMTFPQKKVELYHAKLVDMDRHIVFEPVPLELGIPRVLTVNQQAEQMQTSK